MKLNKNESFKNFQGKEQIQMGLDLENTHSIMSLLRNNIYSDPIKSWVREIYSNAVDAHARVNNKQDAIDVSVTPEKGGYVFIVRDYGPSMDKDTIANVYAKMGKSDKRSGNNEMGGWGLGAKSPLAYTDHFWIETWTVENDKNVYRKWVQYIDPSRVGALSLLEESTWISNKTGTQVTIPFDQKDLGSVTDALQYYLSYTDSEYNLIGEITNDLKISKTWYTHYGDTWCIDLKEENGYWLSEKNEGIAVVGDIPYPIDCRTIFNYFKNNLKDLFPMVHSIKPSYIKNNDINTTLYTGFLNCINYHKFEIRLPIGSVDLNASREDLQYTDRTCGFLFKSLYRMFLGLYDFVRMDLVNHPNYPEACITYNSYEGGFKKHFLKNVKWAKEDLSFDATPPLFKYKAGHDFCTYTLDTVYKNGSTKTKDVLKKSYGEYLVTGSNRYEIVIQDTEYTNFSKFVKYYAQSKDAEYKYKYNYLCVHPKDLECVYDWIKESTPTVKLSNLVEDFKENAPPTSGNRAASGSFKVLIYKYHNERPRAEGIGSYFDYGEVDINPDEEMYYISKDEWEEPPSYTKEMKGGCYHNSNVNRALDSYLSVKGIPRKNLVFTNKVTRNFNDDNWISFFDLLQDDYNKFQPFKEELVSSMFTSTIVERQMPEFIELNSNEINRQDSKYLYLRKFYEDNVRYLESKEEASAFFGLIDSTVRGILSTRNGSYCHYTLENLSSLEEYQKVCRDILEMYLNYLDKLKFLTMFGDYRMIDNYDIKQSYFTEYINLMECKYNLYVDEVKEKPPEVSQEVSEFKLLHTKLSRKFLLEV